MKRPLIIVTPSVELSAETKANMKKLFQSSYDVDCVVGGPSVTAQVVNPYSFTETLGDYSRTVVCESFEQLLAAMNLLRGDRPLDSGLSLVNVEPPKADGSPLKPTEPACLHCRDYGVIHHADKPATPCTHCRKS